MSLTKNEFILALNQLANERGIPIEEIIKSIEIAVLAAYKKEYSSNFSDEISVKIDRESGEIRILQKDKDITPPGFGRIGVQTAKQVILQKLREVEKSQIVNFYQSQIGSLIKGRIIYIESRLIRVDIGKTQAIFPKEEQIKNETYQLNQTLTFLLKKIESDNHSNSRIILSRSDPKLLIELLKKEVPEISSGTIEIKKVVREAGERSKIAVSSNFPSIDPIGACVGQKGMRIQAVTNELGGQEKIDVIQWNDDPKIFLLAAISPAKAEKVEIDEKNKKAKLYLSEEQTPLAIGKGGVNVNLASKLTGYFIDIVQVKTKEEKKEKQNTLEQNQETSHH